MAGKDEADVQDDDTGSDEFLAGCRTRYLSVGVR